MVIAAGILGLLPGILPFRINKIVVAELTMCAGIASWFIKDMWLKLFLLWCVVRVAMNVNQYSELTLHILVFVLVVYQILANTLTKDRVNVVLNIVCWVGLIHSAVTILQSFGVWFTVYPTGLDLKTVKLTIFQSSAYPIYILGHQCQDVLVGCADNTNSAAAFLAMCFPAFFRKRWCFFIPILILAFFLFHALGGIIAACAAALVFLILNFKKRYLLLVIPSAVVFIAYFSKFEHIQGLLMRDRGPVWWFHITHLIAKRPVVGWGLGQSEFLWPIIKKEVWPNFPPWRHSHNEPITLTTELGIIGLILVSGYFIKTFISLLKTRKSPFWDVREAGYDGIVETASLKSRKSGIVETNSQSVVITCGLTACIVASLSIFSLHSAIGLLLIVYMACASYLIQTRRNDGKNP
jgi:hypothetical protein